MLWKEIKGAQKRRKVLGKWWEGGQRGTVCKRGFSSLTVVSTVIQVSYNKQVFGIDQKKKEELEFLIHSGTCLFLQLCMFAT